MKEISVMYFKRKLSATAVEALLHLIAKNSKVLILSDSLTTVNNIKKWNQWTHKKRLECNSSDIIYRIHKITKEKNINLEIKHVFSHLAEKNDNHWIETK
jgi:hypothetical protein